MPHGNPPATPEPGPPFVRCRVRPRQVFRVDRPQYQAGEIIWLPRVTAQRYEAALEILDGEPWHAPAVEPVAAEGSTVAARTKTAAVRPGVRR